jgi:hypothetical protein
LNDANSINYGDSVEQQMGDGTNANDYLDTITNIPPESQPPIDDNGNPPPPKKDTRKDSSTKPPKIGDMGLPQDPKKDEKGGGFLKKLFGKKKDKGNDY